MIFSEDTSNVVYGFDQNSKQWQSFAASTNLDWKYSSGSGKVCIVLNDSIAVAYNSVHSTFCEVKLESELLSFSGMDWINCGDTYGIILTSENIYIYDAQSNSWKITEMINPDIINGINFQISDDYLCISLSTIANNTRFVAYSNITETFTEVTKYDTRKIILDHGFCLIPYSDAKFAIGYSAISGVFTEINVPIDDEQFYGIDPDISNKKSEQITCSFHKTSAIDNMGNVTLTVYVYNSISGQFYTDIHSYQYSQTGVSTKVGGYFIAWAFYNFSDREISIRIFRTSDNTFYWASLPAEIIAKNVPLIDVGGKVFWIWDNIHLVAVDAYTGETNMVIFPDYFDLNPPVITLSLGDDWGVWGYKKNGSDTLNLYYFSEEVDSIYNKRYYADLSINQWKHNNLHFIMLTDIDYGKQWLTYSPKFNYLYEFEASTEYNDVQYVPGDYVYIQYTSKNRLELYDAITNQVKVFPAQTNFVSNNEDHLVFFNSENKITGYSLVTHTENSFQIDKYYQMVSKDDITIISPTGELKDFYPKIIYDGYRNNFAGLSVPDSVGTSMFSGSSGRFCFFLTMTGHIYAYTGETGTMVNIKDETKINPVVYILSQNYPNPFNPSTIICFQLPMNSYVNLKVYDILGQEVATLVNEQKSAGNYEVKFDASNLSSGIYLYKLQVGDFASIKKMILIK